jgi:hypothetical protein
LRPVNGFFELWRIDGQTAINLDVSNPIPFAATKTQSVWVVMAEATPWLDDGNPFLRLSLDPGTYHRRIARPGARQATGTAPSLWCPTEEPGLIAANRSQVEVLTRQLETICRTIHPVEANMEAYGQDISNLLILACTEVEMNLRGIMIANGSKEAKSTNHYVKLTDVLGLESYAVAFPRFPWLAPIRPFAGWKRNDPTNTLPWYAAYNGVKHNREEEFPRASLRRAFEAVTACAILMAAQFGRDNGLGAESDLSRFFHFVGEPFWPTQEGYCSPLQKGDWRAVNHPSLQG